MADEVETRRTLSEGAARQLANATKTRAQWGGITPRWLVNFLAWTPVEAGIFRLNRVKEKESPAADVECSPPRDRNPDLPGDLRRLRSESARIFPQGGHHRPRRADARLRPLQPAVRSGSGTAPPADRAGEGAPGRRADQQCRIRPAGERRAVAADQDAQGPADARRSRRASDQGVEGAGLLPRPSARDRRLRPRMHAPRRAAADRQPVRRASSSPGAAFRWCPPTRSGSKSAERAREDLDPARSAPARRSRAWSGCSSPAFPAKSRRACRCASWASTARRSPPT